MASVCRAAGPVVAGALVDDGPRRGRRGVPDGLGVGRVLRRDERAGSDSRDRALLGARPEQTSQLVHDTAAVLDLATPAAGCRPPARPTVRPAGTWRLASATAKIICLVLFNARILKGDSARSFVLTPVTPPTRAVMSWPSDYQSRDGDRWSGRPSRHRRGKRDRRHAASSVAA